MNKEDVAIQPVGSDLRQSLLEAVNAVGGMAQYVAEGDTVLLKPNFNTADPFPASTDIEFLRLVVEMVYQAGASKVIIGESSTFSLHTQGVMEQKKVHELLYMSPAPEVYNFDEHEWIQRKISGARYQKTVDVPTLLAEVDKMIWLPCLKTHSWAQFTGSLKLVVGLTRPSQRMKLHMGHLQEKIAELNTLFSPDLVIMDARKCFITGGPMRGQLREPDLILAGTSRIDVDIEGVKIIQGYEGNSLEDIQPEKLPQIKLAKKLGVN